MEDEGKGMRNAQVQIKVAEEAVADLARACVEVSDAEEAKVEIANVAVTKLAAAEKE